MAKESIEDAGFRIRESTNAVHFLYWWLRSKALGVSEFRIYFLTRFIDPRLPSEAKESLRKPKAWNYKRDDWWIITTENLPDDLISGMRLWGLAPLYDTTSRRAE